MKKRIKFLFSLCLVSFALFIFYFNTQLYYQPKIGFIYNNPVNHSIIEQLKFLKNEIHHDAADKMQGLFPEGFIFYNVIYGLTWCELASKLNTQSKLYKEAKTEIDWAFSEVNSAKGREIFDENLPLHYGAFYNGWTTLLLGKKLSIQNERQKEEIELFNLKCQQIADAFSKNDSPYLESYSNGTWQADNVICMASLALHDKLFTPKYDKIITEWLRKVKAQLDPKTGLIGHSGNEKSPRGSSQSLINVFLPDIDSVFAKEVFKKYRNNFLENRLGMTLIREYPKGTEGKGDIDSGPVIWDIGGVASIVGIKAMAVNKDYSSAKTLRNNIEALTLPLTINNQKRYFLGLFSMADAFIAWSNITYFNEKDIENSNNMLLIHALSFLLILTIVALLYKTNLKT
jgi:hypothetical protein